MRKIVVCQNTAKQIKAKDSIRQARKFVNIIKDLHSICIDNESQRVKHAFKHLLEIAMTNQKLTKADVGNNLQSIYNQYTLPNDPPEPAKIDNTFTDNNSTESQTETQNEPEQAEQNTLPIEPPPPPDPKEQAKALLKENIKKINLNRSDIAYILLLKVLSNQIYQVKNELFLMQKDIDSLTKQTPNILQIQTKLLYLERLLRADKNLQNKYVRSLSFESTNEEFSSLDENKTLFKFLFNNNTQDEDNIIEQIDPIEVLSAIEEEDKLDN